MAGGADEAGSGSRGPRTAVTLVVVAVLLFFAFWYAMSYIRADDEQRTSSGTSTTSLQCVVQPEDVVLNVYNGTTRDGLAARVGRDLRARGFVVKKIGNYPEGQDVGGTGQIRYGPKVANKVKVVVRHVGELEQAKVDRENVAIDVVLGRDFRDLVAEDRAAGC